MSEMIERVAVAIHTAYAKNAAGYPGPSNWGELSPTEWEFGRKLARAAIKAMREPTEFMVAAAYKAADDDWCHGDKLGWDQISVCHRAMIDAAIADSPPLRTDHVSAR